MEVCHLNILWSFISLFYSVIANGRQTVIVRRVVHSNLPISQLRRCVAILRWISPICHYLVGSCKDLLFSLTCSHLLQSYDSFRFFTRSSRMYRINRDCINGVTLDKCDANVVHFLKRSDHNYVIWSYLTTDHTTVIPAKYALGQPLSHCVHLLCFLTRNWSKRSIIHYWYTTTVTFWSAFSSRVILLIL